MVVCPKCNVEYDEGKKFCRKCGSFLLTVEEPAAGLKGMGPAKRGKIKGRLICPKCKIFYEIGNYCKKCGSLLMEGTLFQETVVQPLEKKSIKRWSKEWLRLFEEKKHLEICLSKLETQRDNVSSDVFDSMLARYQDQLESLSFLHQEIEAQLESVKKRASEEIDLLEKELTPIQERLDEIQSLHGSGAMTKSDFSGEKNDMEKEITSRERRLRKHQQIISLLPGEMGGRMVSPGIASNLFRPIPFMIGCGIIILMATGGYFFWQKSPHSTRQAISNEIVASSLAAPSSQIRSLVGEGQEVEKIRSLFENIRQANLQKNIDLFMSCYSRDFKEREKKHLSTLETWKNFNYVDLSYNLKKTTFSGGHANIRVEWVIRISQKAGGPPQDSRTVLDVTLEREDVGWKIKEIKSVG